MNIQQIMQSIKRPKQITNREQLIEFLGTSKDALEQFNQAYERIVNADPIQKEYAATGPQSQSEYIKTIVSRIVSELCGQTKITTVKNHEIHVSRPTLPNGDTSVSLDEVNQIPPEIRPSLTGTAFQVDTSHNAWEAPMWLYKQFCETGDPRYYHHFRQGLDILDLDEILYAVLGQNPNSMEHWLPQAAQAAWKSRSFRIPNTTFVQVPLPVLQMSRLQYEKLNRTTLDIIDRWAEQVFNLQTTNDYFVKTGVFSSKFDFRNAHVPSGPEVLELGEYLICIANQASQMAGPFMTTSIYGAATSRTWAVREWIPDKENNPTIYRGLPLRTEYRCFVDFDTKELLCVAPYWDPDTMKRRFGHSSDSDEPDMQHDYIIYSLHEKTLMERFEAHKSDIATRMQSFIDTNAELKELNGLTGQWSVDVMENGSDYYLIDMATADTSALSHYVPKGRLRTTKIDWRPQLTRND